MTRVAAKVQQSPRNYVLPQMTIFSNTSPKPQHYLHLNNAFMVKMKPETQMDSFLVQIETDRDLPGYIWIKKALKTCQTDVAFKARRTGPEKKTLGITVTGDLLEVLLSDCRFDPTPTEVYKNRKKSCSTDVSKDPDDKTWFLCKFVPSFE